jgi:hypothetical protein
VRVLVFKAELMLTVCNTSATVGVLRRLPRLKVCLWIATIPVCCNTTPSAEWSMPPSPLPHPCIHSFERPDSRNRWDAPLFTLRPLLGSGTMQEQLEAIAAAVGDAPARQQAAAGPAAGGQQQPGDEGIDAADGAAPVVQSRLLKPTAATDTAASRLSGLTDAICLMTHVTLPYLPPRNASKQTPRFYCHSALWVPGRHLGVVIKMRHNTPS